MDFVIKKTTELAEDEKCSLLECFNEVFGQERKIEEMCSQYLNTPMGYCIHSLCIDNGRIVGAHTAFPSYYWIGDQRVKTFITGDTMVRQDYRDGTVYLEIYSNLTSYMKKDGYMFSFGFPNENSHAVNKKRKSVIDFGRLDTYILPYRIGGIKRGLRFLNPLSIAFCRLWIWCCRIGTRSVIFKPLIHKDDATYNPPRYKRLDGKYEHIIKANYEFYYKIKNQNGVRTAFLIDVIGKSERNFINSIYYILSSEQTNFDLLMYVGHLPQSIKRTGLIRIPQRFEPKHFYMAGKIYDKRIDPNIISDINNWDVNLSDYDLI